MNCEPLQKKSILRESAYLEFCSIQALFRTLWSWNQIRIANQAAELESLDKTEHGTRGQEVKAWRKEDAALQEAIVRLLVT